MKPREDIETIYQVALSAFSEFGYRKTTMDDVAGRLNMTKGNLYLYVKNKKDLYRKTISHALMKWQSKVLEAVDNEADVKKKFSIMCFKAVEYLSEDLQLRQVLIRDPDIFPMFPSKDPFYDINRNSVELIKAILKQGIAEKVFRDIDPDRVSEVVFMVYKMFIIRMYIKTEDKLIHEMFEDTVDLFAHGLFVNEWV
ncbi:MAG: TetR/AcrR family transcriptional regulator [Desulfobacteraceae bacterium]|nr:TetR/AcrR family transcriptional regulator [Desulfobacteraceae bacterium]MBC2756972.1 TetR/AcrR family transcriptional regulator [Desulfobacteraceae bacterium]